MTWEIIAVLIIIAIAFALFISELVPVDLISLGIMAALMISGLVTVTEGLSGFSNQATLTVLAMFILSAGLQKTGVVDWIGRRLLPLAGRSEIRQLIVLGLIAGPTSAFINNTAAVAIFMPLVIQLAQESQRSPSRLLLPLSYFAMLGGVCTLFGTSTNLLANSILQGTGHEGFTLFEFTKLGALVFLVGLIYLLIAGRYLLPARVFETGMTERFQLKQYLSELVIPERSKLIGKTVAQSELGQRFDIDVLGIVRGEEPLHLPIYSHKLQAGDILRVRANPENLLKIKTAEGVEIEPEIRLGDKELSAPEWSLAEAVIAPGSRLAGATIEEIHFRDRYGATVLAIRKHGRLLRERLGHVRLGFGDALLLQGPKPNLDILLDNPNFLVITHVNPEPLRQRKAWIAIAIMAGVILLAAWQVQPIVVTALAGSLAMVLTRCLKPREMYEAVNWHIIFLLAGVIPLGIALEKTGAAQWLAASLTQLVGPLGPIAVLASLYLITTLLTEVISNNAAVALLVPISLSAAQGLGLDPKPFVLAVMFAGSTSFMTPIGYQTNTMVYGPGGYRFFDYTRIGAPLNGLVWLVATYLISRFWPF